MVKPLNIAHIIASADMGWGGPSRVIREMTAAQADQGHHLTLFSADPAPGGKRTNHTDQRPFDPRVDHRVFRANWTRPPYPSARMLWAVAREIHGFDIAHVHGIFNAPSTTALMVLRASKVPYVVRPCGMLDPWSLQQRANVKGAWWRYLDGPSVLGAAAIQCSTPHEVDAVTAALAMLRGKGRPRVVECPQGVGPLQPPANDASPHPRPYVLFLGRVAEKKGILPLVRAMAEPQAPSVDLVIVGPDEYGHAAEVRAVISELGLSARVHLVGPVFDDAEKARWYAHALAFALPSSDENFGITVIEAARFGLPLVVSRDVGLAEAVLRDGAGLIVTREPASIADGLGTALGPDRESFATGAVRLGQRFSWPERAAQLESVYREILASAGPR